MPNPLEKLPADLRAEITKHLPSSKIDMIKSSSKRMAVLFQPKIPYGPAEWTILIKEFEGLIDRARDANLQMVYLLRKLNVMHEIPKAHPAVFEKAVEEIGGALENADEARARLIRRKLMNSDQQREFTAMVGRFSRMKQHFDASVKKFATVMAGIKKV